MINVSKPDTITSGSITYFQQQSGELVKLLDTLRTKTVKDNTHQFSDSCLSWNMVRELFLHELKLALSLTVFP